MFRLMLRSVLRRSLALVAALAILAVAASAAEPGPGELKSGVIRFDEAKANTADWGSMHRYFAGKTFATEGAFVAVAVIEPGKAVHKEHRHAEEEYLAVVEGSGTWSLEGKKFPAQRGDILYVEPWVYHGLTNTGDERLIFLVIKYNGKGVAKLPQPDDRPNELE
jgi:quercetin dioxygenase-like cupin family protein